MNRIIKGFAVLFAITGMCWLLAASDVDAQSKGQSGSSSSKPSSGSSSKPSSGDKPKYTAPPSGSSSKPSSPPSSSDGKPKYTAPPKDPPKSPPASSGSSHDKDKPKFSAPPGKGSPSTTGPPVDSKKPGKPDGLSDKARAQKEAQSERKFVESQKATAPPLPKYTAPNGKEVNVAGSTKAAEHIRNMPSTSLKPEVRQQNITVLVTNNHYSHPYSWYCTQPHVYVGGGYSSAFWWIMMTEWSAQRRAEWLYHHRYEIEADAYARGMRDAQTQAYIDKLERERAYRNPNYIDKDFSSDPSAMYDDDYVHAVYNPAVVPHTPSDPGAALTVLCVLGCIVLGGLILWGVIALLFRTRWGT